MQTMGFKIGSRAADRRYDPYIIAEIGVNHGGDLKLALRLIEEARSGGAHAAKFQSYKADKIASKHSPAYWDTRQEPTRSQHELFRKYDQFGPAEYRALAEHCRRVGIEFLSTPFDLDAVEDLAPLVPAFKIASADITNLPLIRKCAATGKPLIISSGAADLPEIAHAVAQARAAGAERIALLHCVLNYPTEARNAQLGMIAVLQRAFPECPIGYSDHVVPDASMSALEAATLLGATLLEKHFTHDKSLPGNDHYHAMNAEDLRHFVAKIGRYRELISDGRKDLSLERDARLHARRSIVAAKTLRAGQVIGEGDLIAKRPGHGISPVHWDEIVGRVTTREIPEDALLEWDMLASRGAG